MSDDRFTGLVKAAADEVIGMQVPGWSFAKQLMHIVVPGTDLDALQRHWVLEMGPYLCRSMEDRFARLSDELKRSMAPTIAELTAQVLCDLQQTARFEQRKQLVNALVNGVKPDWNEVEHRLFVRAAAEVEPEAVQMMRKAEAGVGEEREPAGIQTPIHSGLYHSLVRWGFIDSRKSRTRGGFLLPGHGMVGWVSELGLRFLDYVRDLEPEVALVVGGEDGVQAPQAPFSNH